MQRTATLNLHIFAECEACGHCYDWQATLTNTTSTGLFVCKDPSTGVMKQMADMRFGLRRCPKCGYLQSWMRKQWDTNCFGAGVFAVAAVTVIGIGCLLGFPAETGAPRIMAAVGYLVLLIVLFLIYWKLADPIYKAGPNKKWHAKNGPTAPPPKFPRIEPA